MRQIQRLLWAEEVKKFLLLLLGLAHSHDVIQTDIVIIGGGMAGISAAATVSRHAPGKYNFIILEATNHTGGRIHAQQFGDSTIKRLTVEVGANWVHGVANGEYHKGQLENHLWNISNTIVPILRTHRVPGSTANCSNYGILNESGSHVIETAKLHELKRIWVCVNKLSNTTAVDMSMKDAFTKCGWQNPARGSVEEILAWEKTSADSTLPIGEMSLWGTVPDSTYDLFGPDDHLVIDPTSRGYARVVDAVAASGDVMDNMHSKIRFGQRVLSIDYNDCSKIIVATRDLKVEARYVINTIPLGALQHDASTMFTPPLKHEQMSALNAFTNGNFTKIFAQWKTPFWDNDFRGILMAAKKCSSSSPCAEQHNLNHASLIPGSNTLLICVVDPASAYWEMMSDADAKVALVKWLKTMYPSHSVTPPAAFYMTRHGQDPLTRGAYSAWSTRMTPEYWQNAFAPISAPHCKDTLRRADTNKVPPTIFFGGEAACNAFNGYAHGAYYSGIKTANKVLEALGEVDVPKTFLCDKRKYTRSNAFWASQPQNHKKRA